MMSTSDALMEAAGDLFAEKGLENTTVREIVVRAGQANTSALHYHFRSKHALVLALISKGAAPIDLDRGRRLAELERDGKLGSIWDLCHVMVSPLIDAAIQDEAARRHLCLLSQVLSSPSFDLNDLTHLSELENANKLIQHISEALAPLPKDVIRLRLHASMALLSTLWRVLQEYTEPDLRPACALNLSGHFAAILVGALTAPMPQERAALELSAD